MAFTESTVAPEPAAPAPDPVAPAPEAQAPEPDAGPSRGPDGRFAPKDDPTFADLAEEYESYAAQEGETVALPKERIGKWNDEHKKYRERFQPYERAFGDLHADDQQDILNFVQALNNPEQRPEAVAWMRGVLDRLSPAEQQKVADAIQGAQQQQEVAPLEEEFDPFDRDAIERIAEQKAAAFYEQKEKARAEQDAIANAERSIKERAAQLGYTTTITNGAPDPDYSLLLLVARQQFGNDPDPLGRAHEVIEARFNARATEILKTKRADAQQVTTPPEGQAPSGRKEPLTMKDAETAARSRLDQIFRGPLNQ